MKRKSEVILLEINTIHPNKKKLERYQIPGNYNNIKWSIESEGIIEPLSVNKKTKEIISGNLRYQVAIRKYTLIGY